MKAILQITKRMHIIALGPHVARELNKTLGIWGMSAPVNFIIPLFPIDSAKELTSSKTFVIQGNVHETRRNYRTVIADVIEKNSTLPNDFKLLILGSGKCNLPNNITNRIVQFSGQKFPRYYRHIQQSIAILTVFSTKDYFKNKASSSVAASLICQTPLLTTRRTIHTYSILSPTSVWLLEKGESDLEGMLRIAGLTNFREEYEKRVNSLGIDIRRAYKSNANVVSAILHG